MAASQLHISAQTPLGAHPIAGGTTFRVWAPNAHAVYVAIHDPVSSSLRSLHWLPDANNSLVKDRSGYWGGFFPGVTEGYLYRYWSAGPSGQGYKRDPRAIELELLGYPDVDCIVRGANNYPWHDTGFQMPAFNDLIIYQLHIGVFYASAAGEDIRFGRVSKFLDVVDRLEYLVALGVNAIQPLPVVEWMSDHSRGYNNTDFYSPEMDYALAPDELEPYLNRVNQLLAKKEKSALVAENLYSQVNQLKALIDLCHVYGIAVILDVVYNHAGGPLDEESLRFFEWPEKNNWWDEDIYFIGGDGWAGGRIFDYQTDGVRQFLIDNAKLFLDEYHADGFRFDEVSVMADHAGNQFCKDLTSTLRYHQPKAIQIAEYWNWDRAVAVTPAPAGLGFDAALHDGLRIAIRTLLSQAASGAAAFVNMDAVRDALYRPVAFPDSWKTVIHIENHDLVDADREKPEEIQARIPALANFSNHRNWYARSRSRVATAILLTAPGIPMLFMGQEFLEDKPWHNNSTRPEFFIHWNGLDSDSHMRDFLQFTSELCWLRRRYPALRGEGINPYFTHNHDRVMAYHRWVEDAGQDVIVIASLSETTHWHYQLPFPVGGYWHEVFNSDAYDSLPAGGGYNPGAVGNPADIQADGPSVNGQPVSANIILPANSLLVFARKK